LLPELDGPVYKGIFLDICNYCHCFIAFQLCFKISQEDPKRKITRKLNYMEHNQLLVSGDAGTRMCEDRNTIMKRTQELLNYSKAVGLEVKEKS
jgi:hypothetical protein